MLGALTTLLLCQLAGESLVHALGLPLPGPVIGMALLFLALLIRAPLPMETAATSIGLLRHLSLLFVPAGVGVVQHLGLLAEEGLRLALVLVVSTIAALAATALTFAGVARLLGDPPVADGQHGHHLDGPS